jgi:hypothetical protein
LTISDICPDRSKSTDVACGETCVPDRRIPCAGQTSSQGDYIAPLLVVDRFGKLQSCGNLTKSSLSLPSENISWNSTNCRRHCVGSNAVRHKHARIQNRISATDSTESCVKVLFIPQRVSSVKSECEWSSGGEYLGCGKRQLTDWI